MKFLTNLSNSIKALSLIMAIMLSIGFSNVFANSCETIRLTTSKTNQPLPSEHSTNLATRLNPRGQVQAQLTQSIALPNLFTDFTVSKTRRLSATSRQSNYDSAARTREALNSSEISTISIFQNSPRTNPTSLKTFYENGIWNTAQKFSDSERPKNFRIFETLPERNSKISPTGASRRLSTRAFSASEAGVTREQWRRHESSWRESSPFSTTGRARYAANWTARLFASGRRKRQSSDSTNSNPATSPPRCMNRHREKRFQKTRLIS